MSKTFFSICFVLLVSLGYAQDTGGRIFLKDVNGQDIKSAATSIDNVSFLFHPDYLKAKLYTKDGLLSGEAKYKLLLQDNRLFYLGLDGRDMEVINPIVRIEFDMPNGNVVVFEKGFQSIGNLNDKNYFQVLVDGRAKLLLDTKFVTETKQVYGSGTVATTDKVLNYYGAIGTKIIKLTNTEDILNLTDDKYDDINGFLKKEKIKLKKQSDLEKLFIYYNTLFK